MPLLDSFKSLFSKSKKPGRANRSMSKSSKLLWVYSFSIVLAIVIMVGMFSYGSTQTVHGKQYAAIANEQQIVSQQIATFALEAATGKAASFVQLKHFQRRFETTLERLEGAVDEGAGGTAAMVLPHELEGDVENIKSNWEQYDANINTILQAREPIETVSEYVTLINESIPELLVLSDDVVKLLVKTKAALSDIAAAARQLALIQGVQNSLNLIMSGGDEVMAAADQFGRQTALIERILIAMLEGNPALGVSQLTGDEVVSKLLQLADLFSVVKKNVNQILEKSPQLFEVRDAASVIQSISPHLLEASRRLAKSAEIFDEEHHLFNLLAYVAGIVVVFLLIFLGIQLVKESSSRLTESQSQNEKNQRAILRLLDEMTNLADGDLSTHTTVTEDITGAIADSVNYSIDALRDLVGTINQTADQVTGAVQKTQSTTRELANASELQAEKIGAASATITNISENMNQVSESAIDSADVARNSVNIAHNGGETVRKTITGMEVIREQIQETSKRIKRLGESSQEIGDIVNLITEISDQTNILALNAAIQAAMAGEAGRGFAVVADEVQRLAERTGDATKQIEALVKTIQTDTSEAMTSMEHSTANVVEGANLAEDAGSALEKIEKVSTNLAQRILQISDATQRYAKDSVEITAEMDEIKRITLKTSEGSAHTSEAIGELSTMVKALHHSVAGFKLPGVDLSDSTVIHDVNDLSEVEIKHA